MERVRSQGGLTRSLGLSKQHLYNGCTPTVWTESGTNLGPYVGSFQTMTDTVVPNFRKRVAEGEVFFNPMYSEKKLVTSSGGRGHSIKSKTLSCSDPAKYHEYRVEGDLVGYTFGSSPTGAVTYPVISQDDVDKLRVEVSTEVLNQRGRSDANLYESLAEAHKAALLLQGLGRRAVRTLTTLKGSSSEWLAYRYGLTPIIRDVEAVLGGINKGIGKTRHTTRAKGQLYADRYTSGAVDRDYITNHYTRQDTDTVLVRGMSLDEYVADFGSNIGFTGKGLLTLPWELLPYSFVADWFLNVGSYIGAMVPTFGYNSLGSCLVTQRDYKSTYVANGTTEQSGTYSVTRAWSGSLTVTLETKSRTALLSPALLVRSDFGFDRFKRAVDAFAIAATLLPSSRKR